VVAKIILLFTYLTKFCSLTIYYKLLHCVLGHFFVMFIYAHVTFLPCHTSIIDESLLLMLLPSREHL